MPRTVFWLTATACITLVACSNGWHEPLPHARSRSTPLSFGLFVTPDPDENPIEPPERFSGYHAAVDYEVAEQELDSNVPIYAACDGEVIYSGFAEGYGGLLVQRCTVSGEEFTVLYGHLLTEGMPVVGEVLQAGEQISVLAPARSADSGFNRKHLHFGIHKGVQVDVSGYVQSEESLMDFVDPMTLIRPSISTRLRSGIIPYWKHESRSSENE